MSDFRTGEEKLRVFISYSRLDVAFADQLVAALEAFGFDPIIDRHDISGGEDWKVRLGALLQDAGSVVFVISPGVVDSDVCKWELEESDRLAKRKIPIASCRLEKEQLPLQLRALNYILFYTDERAPGSGFGTGLKQLVTALKTDLDWIREHTRIGGLAAHWDSRGRAEAMLIRGSALQDAERWIGRQPAGAPDAGDLTRAFLNASRQLEDTIHNKKLREARRQARVAYLAGISGIALAGLAAYAAIVARTQTVAAEQATARAEAVSQDAADVSRLARKSLSNTSDTLRSRVDDLLTWAPPAWAGYLHKELGDNFAAAGNIANERAELDRSLNIDPDLVSVLNSSADNYLRLGDADRAIRDASKTVAASRNDAVFWGNVLLAEAMKRDYAIALTHIDNALNSSQRRVFDTESLVSPDVQSITRGFKLNVRDTDFLLALRYLKAVLLAMMGDDRWVGALEEADKYDRDYPFSRTSYLAALNWEWLIVRGQALHDAKENSTTAGSVKLPIRDYGAYAVEGALWARVASTRPDFAEHRKKAFDKFREAHQAANLGKYEKLREWVDQDSQKNIDVALEAPSPLANALDLELKAIELSRGPNSENNPYSIAPAIALLTEAIRSLEAKRTTHGLGRREEDVLIDLLLLRGDWRLKPNSADEKDYGGAAQDARRILEIDSKVSDAHRLVAEAARDDQNAIDAYEKAIELDSRNTAALAGLAEKLESRGESKAAALKTTERIFHQTSHSKAFNAVNYQTLAGLLNGRDAKRALELRERKSIFNRRWSSDFNAIARLQYKLGRNSEALANIERAIASAPWNASYYERRRVYEIASGNSAQISELHLVEVYHGRAAYYARTGDDSTALRSYVEALHKASALPEGDIHAKLELESVTNDFNRFLVARFGGGIAAQWWSQLAGNQFASEQEKRIAAAVAERMVAKK